MMNYLAARHPRGYFPGLLSAADREAAAKRLELEKLPQLLENVEVADPGALDGAAAVWQAVERENSELDGRGRVLVRSSGTEPLVRVMVEAPSEAECHDVAERLVSLVRRELG